LPRDDFGRLRDGSNAPADVRYVAEYRLKGQTRWTTLATKSSERDANSALHLAMDRGQIPNSAETRVRVEKGVATPDLRFSPGPRKF
ncbi:MAG TPA: hypothetical protein VM510_00225, partial [Caulifigura sp.]|nr:hypothetical protein [Caulifigura sp.]